MRRVKDYFRFDFPGMLIGDIQKLSGVIMVAGILFLLSEMSLFAEDPFRANIYLMGSNKKVLLFKKYNERTVQGNKELLKHVYTLPDGTLSVTETVIKRNGTFSEYQVRFYDGGCSCSLVRNRGTLRFRFKKGGSLEEGTATYRRDLVMGPTLGDFIKSKWNPLIRGKVVRFSLPAMSLQRLATFKLEKLDSSPYLRRGVVVFQMSIDSFFLGLLLDPVQMVYDREKKRVVEIHGPSLLERRVNGKKVDVDADIYYRYNR